MRLWCLLLLTGTSMLCADPYDDYRRGERAATVAKAREAFSAALEGFTAATEEHSSPRLLYNLANCYFQLGEVPTAIVYYRRALSQAPRDRTIRANLRTAEEVAGVLHWEPEILALTHLLSVQERIYAICGVGLLGVAFLLLRRRSAWLRALAVACEVLALFCAGALVYDCFFSAAEAIVVQASIPRCDGGETYAAVAEGLPLPAGSSVKVLDEKDGWLLVRVKGTQPGYIPSDRVVLLD